jgi:preprotein translocase subunit YajC
VVIFLLVVVLALLLFVGLALFALVRREPRQRKDHRDWPSEAGLY